MRHATMTLAMMCLPQIAAADLGVTFVEGAPKDRFDFVNDGCPLQNMTIVIDLRGSAAGLIFDVTGSGAGVDVYQPVEVLRGDVVLGPIADGDQVLHLHIGAFPKGAEVSVTADLDDTAAQSALGQSRVAEMEIVGAKVTAALNGRNATAVFGADGATQIKMPPTETGCVAA